MNRCLETEMPIVENNIEKGSISLHNYLSIEELIEKLNEYKNKYPEKLSVMVERDDPSLIILKSGYKYNWAEGEYYPI